MCGIFRAVRRGGFVLDLCKPSSASTAAPASHTLMFLFLISGSIFVPREAREIFGPTLQRPAGRVRAKYSGRSSGVRKAPCKVPSLAPGYQESRWARLRPRWLGDKEHSGRPKVYKDAELEALLDQDSCQT